MSCNVTLSCYLVALAAGGQRVAGQAAALSLQRVHGPRHPGGHVKLVQPNAETSHQLKLYNCNKILSARAHLMKQGVPWQPATAAVSRGQGPGVLSS